MSKMTIAKLTELFNTYVAETDEVIAKSVDTIEGLRTEIDELRTELARLQPTTLSTDDLTRFLKDLGWKHNITGETLEQMELKETENNFYLSINREYYTADVQIEIKGKKVARTNRLNKMMNLICEQARKSGRFAAFGKSRESGRGYLRISKASNKAQPETDEMTF